MGWADNRAEAGDSRAVELAAEPRARREFPPQGVAKSSRRVGRRQSERRRTDFRPRPAVGRQQHRRESAGLGRRV